MPRRRRRRGGGRFSRVDWLETFLGAVGIITLGLAGVMAYGTIYLIVLFSDRRFDGPLGALSLPALKGLGIALLGVGALAMLAAANWLVGDRIVGVAKAAWRRLRPPKT
jgi:hypothetical protein